MKNWIGIVLVALAAGLTLGGCGSGSGGTSVSITPATAVVATGSNRPFTANVSGGSSNAVIWSLPQGPSAGTITTSGIYTAPGIPGSYTIKAASILDPTHFGTATATVVPSGVTLSITPATVFLQPGTSTDFTFAVQGTTNTGVSFSVQEPGGGTITSAGHYTAPTALGVYHVIATSAADQTVTATALVTVASLTLTPTQATVGPGGSQQFSATLAGLSNNQVSLTVQEPNGGTITNGLYTAPTSGPLPATYHIVASSVANPSIQVSIPITVTMATGISVTITPPTKSLTPGSVQAFNATVNGTTNQGVTFSLQGPGTLTPTGLYTAPGTSLSAPVIVTAASVADPSKTAQATITVAGAPSTLTVLPSSAIVSITPQLTASVVPNGTLTIIPSIPSSLVVQEGAAGGTIINGIYTAPATPGTYHVTATSNADSAQTVTLVVMVQSGSSTVTVQ